MKLTKQYLKKVIKEVLIKEVYKEDEIQKKIRELVDRGKNKEKTGMPPEHFARQLYKIAVLTDKELIEKGLAHIWSLYEKDGFEKQHLRMAALLIDRSLKKDEI